MNLNTQGVGIDLVDVSRFEKLQDMREDSFLKKVFFESELEYCFSHKEPKTHLAGMFALKEATSKALGISLFPFAEIEIKHREDGAPEVWHKGERLNVKVSITHTETLAAAIAVL